MEVVNGTAGYQVQPLSTYKPDSSQTVKIPSGLCVQFSEDEDTFNNMFALTELAMTGSHEGINEVPFRTP